MEDVTELKLRTTQAVQIAHSYKIEVNNIQSSFWQKEVDFCHLYGEYVFIEQFYRHKGIKWDMYNQQMELLDSNIFTLSKIKIAQC